MNQCTIPTTWFPFCQPLDWLLGPEAKKLISSSRRNRLHPPCQHIFSTWIRVSRRLIQLNCLPYCYGTAHVKLPPSINPGPCLGGCGRWQQLLGSDGEAKDGLQEARISGIQRPAPRKQEDPAWAEDLSHLRFLCSIVLSDFTLTKHKVKDKNY